MSCKRNPPCQQSDDLYDRAKVCDTCRGNRLDKAIQEIREANEADEVSKKASKEEKMRVAGGLAMITSYSIGEVYRICKQLDWDEKRVRWILEMASGLSVTPDSLLHVLREMGADFLERIWNEPNKI